MGVEEETSDGGDGHVHPTPRSYWRFSKQDFFPEKSFENWNSYISALSQTRARFKDRLLSRSDEVTELVDLRKQSENSMKRCLTWWDLTWFGFGAVIGTGIFVLTGQEAHDHAGPAIILSYVASGISAMLSVFCYTEFAVEIPVAGGSFAYLRVELGDLAAFITAGNILLESIVGSAAVGRGWTSYFTTLLDRHPDSLRIHTNLHKDFNLLDPIAAGVLMIAAMIAITSAKKTSYLNWIASAVNTVVIIFVIIAGFAHAKTSNLQPFLPFGAKGVFQAAAIVYFAYGGFDNIATMAEETKNPQRDIPLGLLGSMSMITVIYCLMALSLVMMQKYTELDTNAAYSVAFQNVGMKWAKYLVALGALKGMTTVLLVGALGQARYTTHIARSHMIPPWFALVHPKTGTPIYATLLIAIPGAIIAFFSSLDVLAGMLSVSTLFIFMMMAVALLVLHERSDPKRKCDKVSWVCDADHSFFHGNICILGPKTRRVGGVRHHHPRLVLGNTGDRGDAAAGKDPQGVGSSTGAVAAVVVDRHKFVSHGITGWENVRKIRHLHGHHVAVLCVFWCACYLRHGTPKANNSSLVLLSLRYAVVEVLSHVKKILNKQLKSSYEQTSLRDW